MTKRKSRRLRTKRPRWISRARRQGVVFLAWIGAAALAVAAWGIAQYFGG